MIHCAINTANLVRLPDEYHVGNIAGLHAYAMQCNAKGRITSPRSATILSSKGSTIAIVIGMCVDPLAISIVLLRIQFPYHLTPLPFACQRAIWPIHPDSGFPLCLSGAQLPSPVELTTN